MAITKKEIDEIKSRLEKASPGPWRVATTTDGEYILDCDDCVVAATFERKEDAYFVAHAREDIPRLVVEVERLYNRNQELLEFNRMYFAQIKELRAEVDRLRKIAKQYEMLQDVLDELPIDIEDLVGGDDDVE